MLSQTDYELVQADLAKQRIDPNPPKPGLWQRARTVFAVAPTNYFGTRPLFIDTNTIHQKINWAALPPSIIGVLDKAGECDDTVGPESWLNPNWSTTVQGAYDYKKALVMYIFTHCGAWWLNHQHTENDVNVIFDKPSIAVDPLHPTDDERMANMLRVVNGVPIFPEFYIIVRQWAIGAGWTSDVRWLKTAKFRKIHKIVLDVERYWKSYNQYLAYLRGTATADSVAKIESYWIAFSTKHLYEKLLWAMSHGYLPNVDIEIIYSGKWFINAYSPNDLATFLQTKETWPAIWYWSRTVTTTIDNLINVTLGGIPDSWKDTTNYKNAMFGAKQRWVQIGVASIPEVTDLNGNPTSIDVDVYVADDDVKVWLGLTTTPPEPPTCPDGSHYNPDTGQCEPDVVIPPSETEARLRALEQGIAALADRVTAAETLLEATANQNTRIVNGLHMTGDILKDL